MNKTRVFLIGLVILMGLALIACGEMVASGPGSVQFETTLQSVGTIPAFASATAAVSPTVTVSPQPTFANKLSVALYANDFLYLQALAGLLRKSLLPDKVLITDDIICKHLVEAHPYFDFDAAILVVLEGDEEAAFTCGDAFEILGVAVTYIVNPDKTALPQKVPDNMIIPHYSSEMDEQYIIDWLTNLTGGQLIPAP